MKKMYQVFDINTNFESYAMEHNLVGAESQKDLVNHIKDIYPDIMFKEEDGSVSSEPWFTDEQLNKICDLSLGDLNRIKPINNMFTDKPYMILETYAYIE